MLDVEEDAGDEDHRHEYAVHDGRRRVEAREGVRQRTQAERRLATPATTKTTSVERLRRPAEAEEESPGDDDDRDLDRGVR